jgi:4-amino-4-deoxy-L-arabinose transferase-like glycosyltransferase
MGKEWMISTTKHPTFPSWFLEIGFILTGGAAWTTYLVSSIFVFILFYSIWKLSSEFLPPNFALLVTLATCNYRYLNIGSVYYHNNFALVPFWALTVLLFYYALKTELLRYWILTGVAIGFGMMCKYPMGLLAFPLFLFVLCFKETRKFWWKLAVTTAVAFLIFLPHFFWNIHHGFPTFGYINAVSIRTSEHWYSHIVSPVEFLVKNGCLLIPVLISVYPVLFFRRLAGTYAAVSLNLPSLWQRAFLPFIVLVPIVIQVAIPALSGHRMPSRYGSHLWVFFPLLLFYCFSLSTDVKKMYRAFCYTLIVMFLTAASFAVFWMFEPFVAKKPNKTLFPGRQLATTVEKIWHEKYPMPIPYAAGEWLLTGNLAFYGKDRPTVLAFGGNDYFGADARQSISPWVTKNDLYKKGAVILWEIRDEEKPVPQNLESDYPGAIPVDVTITLPFQSVREFPSLRVGIALIPPPESKTP